MRVLIHQGSLQLLVPALVLEEFNRNRPRAEDAVTIRVRERFRLLRNDLEAYADEERRGPWLDELTRHIPLISAMTLQNFAEISDLLSAGRRLTPTNQDRTRVIQRSLDRKAQFT